MFHEFQWLVWLESSGLDRFGRALLLPAAVDLRGEVLAHLEEWQALGRNVDDLPCLRVPPLVSFVASGLERPEPLNDPLIARNS